MAKIVTLKRKSKEIDYCKATFKQKLAKINTLNKKSKEMITSNSLLR